MVAALQRSASQPRSRVRRSSPCLRSSRRPRTRHRRAASCAATAPGNCVRPRARPDRLPRRSRPPRSDSRRRGRTTGTTFGPDCSRPSRVAESACRTGRRDFRGANSWNRIEPNLVESNQVWSWRISLPIVFVFFEWDRFAVGTNVWPSKIPYTFLASFARQSCASA